MNYKATKEMVERARANGTLIEKGPRSTVFDKEDVSFIVQCRANGDSVATVAEKLNYDEQLMKTIFEALDSRAIDIHECDV